MVGCISGRPIYRHKTNLISIYLHHTEEKEHNWAGWQFTRDVSDVFGFTSNGNEDKCPTGSKNEVSGLIGEFGICLIDDCF